MQQQVNGILLLNGSVAVDVRICTIQRIRILTEHLVQQAAFLGGNLVADVNVHMNEAHLLDQVLIEAAAESDQVMPSAEEDAVGVTTIYVVPAEGAASQFFKLEAK